MLKGQMCFMADEAATKLWVLCEISFMYLLFLCYAQCKSDQLPLLQVL